jgi:hypothetical protein
MNTENNKIIAEFLGQNKMPYEFPQFGYIKTNGDWNDTFFDNQLKFHKDWNWLMEVVEKIELNGKYVINGIYDNRGEFKGWYPEIFTLYPKDEIKDLTDLRFESKIQAVYNACVSFIEWYNQNK